MSPVLAFSKKPCSLTPRPTQRETLFRAHYFRVHTCFQFVTDIWKPANWLSKTVASQASTIDSPTISFCNLQDVLVHELISPWDKTAWRTQALLIHKSCNKLDWKTTIVSSRSVLHPTTRTRILAMDVEMVYHVANNCTRSTDERQCANVILSLGTAAPRGIKKSQTRVNMLLDYAPSASFQTMWLTRQWPDFKARELAN